MIELQRESNIRSYVRERGRNTGRKDDEGTTERRERKSAKRRRRLLGISLFLRRRCCLFSKEFPRAALRKLQWLFPSNTVVMGTVFGTTVPCTRCKVSLPPFMGSMTRMSLLSCVPLPHALEQQQRHKKTHFFVTRATVHTQSFFTLIREEQIKVYTCRQCSAKNPTSVRRKIPHIHWAALPLIVVALSSSVLNGLEKQFHTLETEEEELERLRVHVSLSLSLRSVCVSVSGGGQYRLSNNHCLLCCRARQGLFSLEKKGRPIALLDLCTRAGGNSSRTSSFGGRSPPRPLRFSYVYGETQQQQSSSPYIRLRILMGPMRGSTFFLVDPFWRFDAIKFASKCGFSLPGNLFCPANIAAQFSRPSRNKDLITLR